MYNFCTLFDSNYLSRGLAMIESLRGACGDFHLYVFPFDEKTRTILERLALPSVTLVPRKEFEGPELLAVKPGRTDAEYCWTATSSAILHVLEKYGVDHCTYIDADLYFYESPGILIDEMGEDSILITEHRYSPPHAYLAPLSGRFCVQFITFRNDERGLRALRWWRDACLEWCYARAEDGKYGDQKYLDDWPARFDGVHILEHLGGGVAPWNIQQYDVHSQGTGFRGTELATGRTFELVFYHFHYVRIYAEGKIDLGDFSLTPSVTSLLYRPYLRRLEMAKERVRTIDPSFDPHGPRTMPRGWKMPLINLKRIFLHRYNIHPLQEWIIQETEGHGTTH